MPEELLFIKTDEWFVNIDISQIVKIKHLTRSCSVSGLTQEPKVLISYLDRPKVMVEFKDMEEYSSFVKSIESYLSNNHTLIRAKDVVEAKN